VTFTYTSRVLQKANYGDYFETYTYNSITSSSPYLTEVRNHLGELITSYSYDAQGRPISTARAGGVNKFVLDYTTSSTWVVVGQPTGVGVTRAYAFTKPLGRRLINRVHTSCPTCTPTDTWYKHDANLNLIEESTGNSKSCFSFDNSRNLELSRIDGADSSFDCATMNGGIFKRRIATTWDTSFRLPSEKRTYDFANNLVSLTAWTYNSRGQVFAITKTDPVTSATRIVSTTYCEAADVTAGLCPFIGLVTSINGQRSDVADTTTYTYYADDDATCVAAPASCPHRKGDLWKVTDALGGVTETLAYDGAGRVLSIKDNNGVLTELEYHSRGWLSARKLRGSDSAVETDDQITQIEYWPTGLVKKVTQPDGAFTAYTYDAAQRLTDITDNAGNTIHYTLDNTGNHIVEETKDASGTLKRTLSRVYNQLGQLQTTNDAYSHATGFTYDANGNNQTVTDALGRVTDNDYDPLNRLARTLQDVGGIEAETKFEYDALDNLIDVTDPKGLHTTYQYNGFGDLTQLTSPDTGTTTYTYDSAGNRQTQTDARDITSTYSYDALNRLSGIAYPTTSLNVGYLYDTTNLICTAGETFAIGRLSQMIDSSGNTQYCYDRFGNLVHKMQTTNGHVFVLRYVYTKAGQLQSMVYPDGAIVDYVRDGQGRITEVGTRPAGGVREVLLHQAAYHPFGPVAGWAYGNGRTMSRPLNQNYQPTAVVDNAAGGLSLGYEFDAVGNLSKLYSADQTNMLAQYGYDSLNRLADVKDGPTGTVLEHYGYDATGNRTTFTNAGGTISYTYSGTNHRLIQVSATTRSYDGAGNTTQIGGTAKEFVYNDAGRMSQVKASGAATMNYQLNGRGEQVRKYLGAISTYTIYDEAGRWIGDYDSTGTAIQQSIWMDNLPIGIMASNQLKYLQPDHLGTPRVVVEPATDVAIWSWALTGEAFGNTVPNQDLDGNGISFVLNMRFPGQRYDSASGLSYNYLRDYEPTIGRYVKSDPIGLAGGFNTYSYVSGNPSIATDYLGLRKVILFGSDDNKMLSAANSYKDVPGICAVYGHGGRHHVTDFRVDVAKRFYDEEELAELLASEGCTKDMSVILYTCNAANGENSISERLAKSGKFNGVTGPTSFIWYTPDASSNGPKYVYGVTPYDRMDLSDPGLMWVYP